MAQAVQAREGLAASLLRRRRPKSSVVRRLNLGSKSAGQKRRQEPRLDFANDGEAGPEALGGVWVMEAMTANA